MIQLYLPGQPDKQTYVGSYASIEEARVERDRLCAEYGIRPAIKKLLRG